MTSPQQQQSLAELCSVCYTEAPKYRCPRCKTQTCSLSCYKRHQQRASCNGQRDPAAYLRKSEWATPSGIDHDYNYLKTVERRVDIANRDLQDRGIAGGRHHGTGGGGKIPAGERNIAKAWAPGSALQRYLAENDVRIERAPVGMTRQRANRTRVTPKGKVMWMVEWIEGDGERRGERSACDESAEGRTVRELWGEMVARRVNAEKGKKRKRVGEAAGQQQKQPNTPSLSMTEEGKLDDTTPRTKPETRPSAEVEPRDSEANEVPSGEARDMQASVKEQDDSKDTTTSTSPAPLDPRKETSEQHFYLEKALTASSARVLIPIDPTATLTACLRGRTVLEYPTIYVFSEGPEALPAGYQLEEDYLQLQKSEHAEVEGLIQQAEQSGVGATRHSAAETPLDANSILDMLKRDVGA